MNEIFFFFSKQQHSDKAWGGKGFGGEIMSGDRD